MDGTECEWMGRMGVNIGWMGRTGRTDRTNGKEWKR